MLLTPTRRILFLGSAALFLGAAAHAQPAPRDRRFADDPARQITDAQWRAQLSPDAYAVLRHQATERPGTSPLLDEHRNGQFVCAGCALPLFQSARKYESGTGWPSFFRAIDENVSTRRDLSHGMDRIEYHCARCLGHQGHLFNDGPRVSGLRYCNNGVALRFIPA